MAPSISIGADGIPSSICGGVQAASERLIQFDVPSAPSIRVDEAYPGRDPLVERLTGLDTFPL